jgi:hypothetical protein
MNAGDRDFVENFVAQTKAEKNLSVVCDARCVLMKMEGTMLLTTTAPDFSENQRLYKQGYRLIGGFVLSGKTMGDRVMDWVCPVVRVKVAADLQKVIGYCIAKAVVSYMGGRANDAVVFDPKEMEGFDPTIVNILTRRKA